jgi:YfiH family protein
VTLPEPQDWLFPDWRPHRRVRVCITTRRGELSPSPWQGFNLGINCGDEPGRVRLARSHVHRELGTDHPPAWLQQVHGTDVVTPAETDRPADAVWTGEHSWPCVVLTADCLPVLLARRDGTGVAAAHAGWRGLHAGVIEQAVAALAADGAPVAAWLGPAICRRCYQVGEEVHRAFVEAHDEAAEAFVEDEPAGRWRMDLNRLAEQALARAGVTEVAGGEYCSHCHNDLFYSYRYEGQTGRFASLIWLE